MAYKRKTSTNIGSKIANRPKRFVRYEEGAEFYSLGIGTFERLAKEAGALYKINRIVLVNLDIVDEYMENYKYDVDTEEENNV